MKSRTVVGIGLALVVVASTAVAWDDANRTVSKLGVQTIENPSSTNITASDEWTFTTNVAVNGSVTIKGSATVTGTFSAGATNITAGTVLNAVSGINVTNLNGANIASGNIPIASLTNAFPTGTTFTFTNVMYNGGASSSDWVFVNGRLINP